MIVEILCIALVVVLLTVVLSLFILRSRIRARAALSPLTQILKGKEVIGFFHPYCDAGGGGERVLWCAIDAVQREHTGVHCVVYTGDVSVTGNGILEKAKSRFGVALKSDSVHFVHLTTRSWVEAATWPRFTLLGQSLGSLRMAYEALCLFIPDTMLDTMGYAFTYPLFRLAMGHKIGAYVHYPTISTDMLERVRTKEQGVCNDERIARSQLLSTLKLLYYRVFAFAYGGVGRFASVVMTNSSWTRGHIDHLWRTPTDHIFTVYPPCDTSALEKLALERVAPRPGGQIVLSLAQFRPEKDHSKQLRAFKRFLDVMPQHARGGDSNARVRLMVVGGCRDDGDRKRLSDLQKLAVTLDLRERQDDSVSSIDWDVAFCPNLEFKEVHNLLGQATVGLHTMKDEHFGISVVEFMAAGALVLAHNSAGPAMDIVRPVGNEVGQAPQRTGFLATDEESYALALREIFALSTNERLRITKAARESVSTRFSQQAFEDAFSRKMIAAFRA